MCFYNSLKLGGNLELKKKKEFLLEFVSIESSLVYIDQVLKATFLFISIMLIKGMLEAQGSPGPNPCASTGEREATFHSPYECNCSKGKALERNIFLLPPSACTSLAKTLSLNPKFAFLPKSYIDHWKVTLLVIITLQNLIKPPHS